jgi:hypothetical protein
VEAAAFHDRILVVRMNCIVDKLPRITALFLNTGGLCFS